MNDVLLDDSLNPRFVHYSLVRSDELDPFDRLSKPSLTRHIDAAISAWQGLTDGTVTDVSIEYLEPVIGAQTLRIDLWVEYLDGSSCVYGFYVSSEDGNIAFARGERTIVRIHAPWSDSFRVRLATLLKNLPAYA
ncbi:MAG TPA: hotdog domain-containing protein [Thermoanaerobaculia bacterium]